MGGRPVIVEADMIDLAKDFREEPWPKALDGSDSEGSKHVCQGEEDYVPACQM